MPTAWWYSSTVARPTESGRNGPCFPMVHKPPPLSWLCLNITFQGKHQRFGLDLHNICRPKVLEIDLRTILDKHNFRSIPLVMSQYPSTWHWHALTHTAWGRSPHGSKAPADMLVKTLEPCWPNEIFQCPIQWLTNLQKKSAYMIIIYVHIMCATRSWVTKWVGLAGSMDRNHQPLSWNCLDDVTWRSGSLSAWRPINIWDQRTVWFRIIIFGEKNVSCMLLKIFSTNSQSLASSC